jgi:16S rRNA C967 or C1407 C5-methylase (RsmB/RsmF family)
LNGRGDPLVELAQQLSDGNLLIPSLAGPFRRAVRVHPRRGRPQGWSQPVEIPWNPGSFFTGDDDDPSGLLDYHTGCVYPQDAASQVPALLLDARPGETVIDACAAPGSKSTQLGLALGDDGLLICLDASAPRRRVLAENLARQGIACALVTPMRLEALAERHPGCADAVLVDAPCSGHEPRSARQVARMAARQTGILAEAARLVRAGGRLVYSTCTPYREENEAVVVAFLAAHAGWRVEPVMLPGCDADLDGLGVLRLWPHRQRTEPFFACRLRAPGEGSAASLSGTMPEYSGTLASLLPASPLHCWRRGQTVFVGTRQVAACALPSEARGLVLGHGEGKTFRLDPWATQALVERGADAVTVSHAEAIRLWAGEILTLTAVAGALARTEAGAPLGQLASADGGLRLVLPSRMRRANLR